MILAKALQSKDRMIITLLRIEDDESLNIQHFILDHIFNVTYTIRVKARILKLIFSYNSSILRDSLSGIAIRA